MSEKLEAELDLAEEIWAVDADDVAERVLNTHFIRDLMGNLSAFSKQKFRCTKCNTSYRRMPLAGKCTKFKGKGICNGNIIPTVHEGSVKKYLEVSRKMVEKYKVSEYTRQRVEVLDLAIESTFGEEKQEQPGPCRFHVIVRSGTLFISHTNIIQHGSEGIQAWPTEADSRSVLEEVRGFKSLPSHQAK